jgi:hypothetical protein
MNKIPSYKFISYIGLLLITFSCDDPKISFVDEWKEQMMQKSPSYSVYSKNIQDQYDFGFLWLDKRASYIGYIGDNYQKMNMDFVSINKKTPVEYSVKGRSEVRSNKCDFEGTIRIIDIRELKTIAHGLDDEILPYVIKEGFIVSEFILHEDKLQQGSGIFKGISISKWYINDEDILKYDDIELLYSDSYANNLFLGTWTSYKTKVTKKCAWGHYRIPLSGDLDIGAAEFSVNPKYEKNGWIP